MKLETNNYDFELFFYSKILDNKSMKKINIYTILSPLHDDESVLNERNELLKSLEKLTNFEFKIVGIDDLYKGDLSIILVESGGSENYFLEVYKTLKEPYIFLTFTHNNSLAASLEILTFLSRNNKKGEILHGKPEIIAKRLIELIGEKDA